MSLADKTVRGCVIAIRAQGLLLLFSFLLFKRKHGYDPAKAGPT